MIAKGVGDGHIFGEMRNEIQKITLHDVLYVSQLDDNLISVKCIMEKGYRVLLKKEDVKYSMDDASLQRRKATEIYTI